MDRKLSEEKAMRCAIYTRVSTNEQAKQEYSSLERQREVCEHYIEIHKEDGWKPGGVYEDPGYSGKDLVRPGLQDLLEDIRQGKIDIVVTYKIDPISRSLKDFYQFWEILQQNNAKFVSATQNFDTSDSTGMLMLNILLSFAQFEREMTREIRSSQQAACAVTSFRFTVYPLQIPAIASHHLRYSKKQARA